MEEDDNARLEMLMTSASTPASNFSSIDYACLHKPTTSHQIFVHSSLVFVVVGLVGNTLSMLVFSSREMLPVSSNAYLLMLSISDSLYLIAVFQSKLVTALRCIYFPGQLDFLDAVNASAIACKLFQYLTDLFADYSACLILAFTIERFIAVYRPVQFKLVCTTRRARRCSIALLGVIALLIAPYHAILIDRLPIYNVCAVSSEHEALFTTFYTVEMFLFRVMPVVVIATLNVLIIIRVSQVTRQRNRKSVTVTATTTNKSPRTMIRSSVVTSLTPETAACLTSVKRSSASRTLTTLMTTRTRRQTTKREDRGLQLTIMLILVSSTYAILYIPVLVHFILHHLHLSELVVGMTNEGLDTTKDLTRALYVFGFGVNFLLYTMSGSVFSRQLIKVVRCHGQGQQSVAALHAGKSSAAAVPSRFGRHLSVEDADKNGKTEQFKMGTWCKNKCEGMNNLIYTEKSDDVSGYGLK